VKETEEEKKEMPIVMATMPEYKQQGEEVRVDFGRYREIEREYQGVSPEEKP